MNNYSNMPRRRVLQPRARVIPRSPSRDPPANLLAYAHYAPPRSASTRLGIRARRPGRMGGIVFLLYVVERYLLTGTAPLFGPAWLPTAQTSLECLIFAGSGWIAGRLNRSAALITALGVAGTLCLYGVSGTSPSTFPGSSGWRLTRSAIRATWILS